MACPASSAPHSSRSSCDPSDRRACLSRDRQKPDGRSARVAVATCASWRCWSRHEPVSTATPVVLHLARWFTLVHLRLPCLVPLGAVAPATTGDTLRPPCGGGKQASNHYVYISISAYEASGIGARESGVGSREHRTVRGARNPGPVAVPECRNAAILQCRLQDSGTRCPEPGARCPEPSARSPEPGARSPVPGGGGGPIASAAGTDPPAGRRSRRPPTGS